jgi:putative endonuclease
MYVVYVLYCLKYNTKYIGQTNDLIRRMNDHLNGRVAYTKTRKPFLLVYTKPFKTRSEAVEHERYLKSRSGRRYLDKIL